MRVRQLTPNLIQLTRLRFVNASLAAMATSDRELNLESARSLRALEPRLLAVGHGSAVRDPDAATSRAIGRAHRALC